MRASPPCLRHPAFALSRCAGFPRRVRRGIHNLTTGGGSPPIEEQGLFQHHRRPYYPVKIGDVFHDQYRVLAKLGYGAYSTVWLARDQSAQQYACLKVCVHDDTDASAVVNEVNMLDRLEVRAAGSDHPGVGLTRLARDIFEIEGPAGRHHCLVLDPQENSLRTLQELLPDGMLPKLLVRSAMHRVLFALNWLHLECGVIHTDVSPQNILMKATDSKIFEQLENRELEDPSVPIVGDDRVPIYTTRPIQIVASGNPVLADFGKMRLYEPGQNEWCMPDLYRAPEVLLKLPWHHSVDVWSVAVMTLELLEGRNLFSPIDYIHRQYVLPLALAQYIGYLGPPPLDLLKQSPLFPMFFDEAGNWIGEAPIPETSLEDFVTVIPAGEEKEMFLRFIRKLLTWDPDVRATSGEILTDEWLMRPTELM